MPDQPYTGWKGGPPPVTEQQPTAQGDQPTSDQALPPLMANLVDTNIMGWGQSVEYFSDMGLRSSPVAAGPGAMPQQFYRKNSGATWKVISCVSIACVGDGDPMPVVPSPDTGNANDTFMWWRAVLFSPKDFLEGEALVGLLTVYFYALQQPIKLGVDPLDFGASPTNTRPAAAMVLNPQSFVSYLSQASAVSGAPGTPINY